MKVILNQTVPKVGKEGTIVTVKDGYARNYLFPRGLAILADKGQLVALERRNAKIEAKTAGEKAAAEALCEKLQGQTIRIEGKVGADSTKLFGAVTSQDIVDEIKRQLKHSIDKKQVALIEPIKRLGKHEVHLDLHRSVDAFITVDVFDPNAKVEEPAKEESKAEVVEAGDELAEPVEA
jgi:large subunit ribosomal protein L9